MHTTGIRPHMIIQEHAENRANGQVAHIQWTGATVGPYQLIFNFQIIVYMKQSRNNLFFVSKNFKCTYSDMRRRSKAQRNNIQN